MFILLLLFILFCWDNFIVTVDIVKNVDIGTVRKFDIVVTIDIVKMMLLWLLVLF